MLKSVTLDPYRHGRMAANWDSEGMKIFSGLDPSKQAQLVNIATTQEGRATLEAIVPDQGDARDAMTLLVQTLEKLGLDGTREALGVPTT